MTVTVSQSVTANAGPDQSTCNTSTITLVANAATGGNWIGGAGTFSPNRNTSNATYTPALSEVGTTVILTWNIPDPDGAGPCSSSLDAMALTVTNSSNANAGPDQTICGTSTITLAANTATGGNWVGGVGHLIQTGIRQMLPTPFSGGNRYNCNVNMERSRSRWNGSMYSRIRCNGIND
jgi:hypothetical protein